MIWLARRYAGEKVTLDEATDFPLDTFMLVGEDDDEAEAQEGPDPKAPASNRAARRAKAKSST
jgi:hypothetical protein